MNGIDGIVHTGLIIVLFSSFVKVAVIFSILSFAFGLDRFGMGVATFAFALAVSFIVMGDQDGSGSTLSKIAKGEKLDSQNYSEFVTKNADPKLIEKFSAVAVKISPDKVPAPEINTIAFLVTELREAFKIGFMLLVPLLIIDLLVVNVLMALGITQISASFISIPLKILLFIAVDGWVLLTEKILSTYM
ncbi:MAG: hypothetical protein KDD56_04725 [Bdellovibrionales bacterium]|nr:hypothetical protein [Bdellovibrionales bacterium]